MKAKTLTSILALVVLTAVSLTAGVVPGRWEKVEALPQGEPITVILKTGDRIDATFVRVKPDVLIIRESTGHDAKVSRLEVSRVEGKVDEGVANGVLLGAAIGFAGPVIVTFASRVDKTEYPLGLGIGVTGAIAGGLIGWRVDKSRTKTELLYQASP